LDLDSDLESLLLLEELLLEEFDEEPSLLELPFFKILLLESYEETLLIEIALFLLFDI
jgi:hypothetical protein